MRGGVAQHFRRIDARITLRDNVTHQSIDRTGVCGHRRPTHPVAAGQDRLDLAELHPLSSNLHLEVVAAYVFQSAHLGPAHEVTGAVHAGARTSEGVRHERRCCHTWAPMVSTGQSRSRRIQFAHHTHRDRLQPRIEDYYLDAAARTPTVTGSSGDSASLAVV